MPIGCDPGQRVEFQLPSDKPAPGAAGVPGDGRSAASGGAVFFARFPTAREAAEIERLMQRSAAAEDRLVQLGHLLQAVSIFVVGWTRLTDRLGKRLPSREECRENANWTDADGNVVCALPKPIAMLADTLTYNECFELYVQALVATRATEAELGKSASPYGSGGASSASNAGQNSTPPPATTEAPTTANV